jgi:dTDP-4-amino-4,6-dideoxygalactose transaminase
MRTSSRLNVPLVDLGAMHDELRPALEEVWSSALSASSFIGGDDVAKFEDAWARTCARRYAIGVANGTDAIAIALRAIGVGPGDEVMVPTNTFIATAEGILAAGATPRFLDVDERTHLVDASIVEEAIGPKTAAVFVVHLHGNMPDMDAITSVADRHGIALLEDAAQAHGSSWRGRPAGSFGIASSFSFYPGKNLGALGDAGAIVTDDPDVAARARSIANHGRAVDSPNVHVSIGVNSRLDAIQAAVLSRKLPILERWNRLRRIAAARYDAAFSAIGGRIDVLEPPEGGTPSYHHYVVRVADRARLQNTMTAEGVDTGIHYPTPCHLQEPYRRFAERPLRVSETLSTEILSVPMYPHIRDDQIDLVTETIGRVAAMDADGWR